MEDCSDPPSRREKLKGYEHVIRTNNVSTAILHSCTLGKKRIGRQGQKWADNVRVDWKIINCDLDNGTQLRHMEGDDQLLSHLTTTPSQGAHEGGFHSARN